MKKTPVNPWSWSLRVGYHQGEIVEGATRQLNCAGQTAFTAGWMFSAWCELRQDFRTFRFDRVAALTSTDEVFDDDAAKGLHAFLETERRGERVCSSSGALLGGRSS